jgi:cardiolipin synthase
MPEETADEVSHKILTIPNVLSMLRLAFIPVFVWLALGPEADGWAFFVLAVSSITDWLDGVIARRFHMESRVGQLLDPIADRLFVISTILVLAIRGIVPWWLVAVLLLRDVFMGLIQLWVSRKGVEPLPVHYVGKAATLCLLYGMPILFLATGDNTLSDIAQPLAWAFIVWGTGIYWWSAVLYAEQASAVVHGRRVDVTA